MPIASIQELSKKVKFLTESLAFLSGRVGSAIEGSQSGSVNISALLGAESEQFISTTKAMGFSLSEQDKELTHGAKNGEIVISRLTLEDWLSGIGNRAKEMTLLDLKLENSTLDTQNALVQELEKLEADMENVPAALPPPNGRARAFYTAMATARTLVAWTAVPYQFQYDSLLKGLDKRLAKEVNGDDRYFRQNVLGDIRRQTELELGKDFNMDSSYSRGYAKWEKDTLKKMGLESEGSFSRLVNTAYELSKQDRHGNLIQGLSPTALGELKEQARKAVADMFNFKLQKELPNLGKNLLNDSEYHQIQSRLEERSRRQQSGRLYGSAASLWAVADEALYAGLNADGNGGTHALKAAQYLASALQVPFSFAMATYEARRDGSKSTREVVDSYLDMHKQKAPGQNIIALQTLDGGGRVSLENSTLLSPEKRTSLIAAAEMSKFDVRSLKEMRKELGKNSVFLLADFLSLAVDVNDAVTSKKLTDLEKAKLAMNFLTDLSFLASDASGIAVSGSKVVKVGKGLGAAAVGFALLGSLINIAAVADKYADNPRKQRDEIILAVYNFFGMAASIGASYFHPSAGVLLTMLLPNAVAISQALDLNETYYELMKSGRTLEAQQVNYLHTIAALDATPILNLFGPVYRGISNVATRLAPEDVDPWVDTVFQQRMASILTNMTGELREIAGKAGVSELHLVTAMNQQIQFSERPDTARGRSGKGDRAISSWVDFAVKREQIYSGELSIDKEREGSSWQAADFRVQEALTEWKNVNGVDVPVNFIEKKKSKSVTLKGDKEFTMSELRDRTKPFLAERALYVIEKGSADKPAELVLDHANSRIDTTYQSAEVAGLRIRSGSGNDVFQLGVVPLELDGGEGFNVAAFGLAKGVVTLDMNKGKNISLWVGAKSGTIVTGTKDSDNYRSADGAVDVVSLGEGDDMAAVGINARVNMGDGDDATFFMDIPVVADGGAGNDVVSFQQMKKGIGYSTDVSQEGVGAVHSMPLPGKVGYLQNYEAFIATQYADKVAIYEGDSIKTWSLDAGDDVVTLGSVSGVTIFLGEGNNTVTSADETERVSYDNVAIHGGDGIDRIDLRLNNSRRLTINGGGGNDDISVEAAFRSSSNKVEIIGGKGDDTIRLKGNVEAMLRFGGADGVDNIYDDVKREKPLTLVFGGQLNAGDIKTSVIKDGVAKDTAGRPYAWIVELTGGDTKVRLHTYTLPAEILVQTTADSSVSAVDLASLWRGNTSNEQATAHTQRQTSLLLDSMAGFGSRSGADSASSLHVRETPRVTLAVAA